MKTWLWLLAIVPFGPAGILMYGLAGPKDAAPELRDWFDPRARRKRRNR